MIVGSIVIHACQVNPLPLPNTMLVTPGLSFWAYTITREGDKKLGKQNTSIKGLFNSISSKLRT